MQAALLLIAGLALLTFAGDALVRGGVALARHFGVPPLIVGLTIISMGTSAPELFVSLEAAFNGFPGIAVGNVVGSNIANVLAVLGLPALLLPVTFAQPGLKRSTGFMLGISALLVVLALDSDLSLFDGVMLIALMACYLGYSYVAARKGARRPPGMDEEVEDDGLGLGKALVFMALGFAGLFLGGNFTIEGALGIAAMFGLAESAVGSTIVALGTSLPEIAATVAAALRGSGGVAIGNAIGSNVFNILGILGITATVSHLPVQDRILAFDLWVMLGVALLLMALVLFRRPLGKVAGLLLIAGYCAYLYLALGS